jgi:hypothetical protein
MMDTVASSLVLAGVVIHGVAAWLMMRLIRALPTGSLRTQWRLLLGMVAFFIAGYLAYLVYFPGRHDNAVDLIVPGIFFMGAGFVALVAGLMLRTTRDLRRMSVLETENVTDALTGLHNRRDFERHARGVDPCAKGLRPLFLFPVSLPPRRGYARRACPRRAQRRRAPGVSPASRPAAP